ncbi:MAG: c-type cytochrome [Burkholderiales bacterium]|jgi:cytochrome c|nr:c-type cytochrome [Burkholderiales bacterium]MBP6250516.1 c-type cytochrome [Leptothrix sp. (in: b-proteobacteria)]MBP7522680.1 c-type cytochrome [Leptothrix sp. (in: b-proteobacteria)]
MTTLARLITLGCTGLLATLPAFANSAAQDEAMIKLATGSGCMTCHHVDPGAKGPEGLPPIGPAWRDVAAKYRGDKAAQGKLTQAVLKGSNPYDSHWKGKASGLAMPPNAVAIKEAEAKKLVGWILQLQPK